MYYRLSLDISYDPFPGSADCMRPNQIPAELFSTKTALWSLAPTFEENLNLPLVTKY